MALGALSTAVRLLLAPNAFKGSFGAVRVARVWEAALRSHGVDTVSRPLADGGDGSLEVWEERLGEAAARVWFVARDARGVARRTPVLWRDEDGTGYVESALACGLAQVAPAERDPFVATTFGVGQLIAGLLGMGARQIVVGLGGSATVDGGLGLARALGYRFRRAGGAEIETPADLDALAAVEPPARSPWQGVRIVALTDVTSRLLGPDGAARVFGPQKFAPPGPLPGAIDRLERGLERLARRLAGDLGADVADLPGGGAAGGVGAALAAFAGAELRSGAKHFLELGSVPRLLDPGRPRVSAAVTGEGSFDDQSERGKVVGELRRMCERAGVPLVVIAGRATRGAAGGVLTGADLDPPVATLDEDALARLAVEAVRRLKRPAAGQVDVARPQGGV